MLPFYRAWLAPQQIAVPVVAAVNGLAVGAGLCLALACDLRYASPSATFSAPFMQLGTHGGMGVSWLLPEAVGMPRARELLYTGRVVTAEEALTWGLISDIAEDVVGRALEVAEGVARAAPIATRLTKAGLAQGSRGRFELALQWEGWPSRSPCPPRTSTRASRPAASTAPPPSTATRATRRDFPPVRLPPGSHCSYSASRTEAGRWDVEKSTGAKYSSVNVRGASGSPIVRANRWPSWIAAVSPRGRGHRRSGRPAPPGPRAPGPS